MRYSKRLFAALAVTGAAGAGMVGCGSPGEQVTVVPAAAESAVAAGGTAPTTSASASASAPPRRATAPTSASPVGQPHADRTTSARRQGKYSPVSNGPVPGATASGARSAAARFGNLYFGGQFSGAWAMLTPAAQREVPRAAWVAVHGACPPASRPTVTSVTLFGTAAIITESAGAPNRATVRYVLSYSRGTWRFAPGATGIYRRGSAAADVAAAKADRLCAGQPQVF